MADPPLRCGGPRAADRFALNPVLARQHGAMTADHRSAGGAQLEASALRSITLATSRRWWAVPTQRLWQARRC